MTEIKAGNDLSVPVKPAFGAVRKIECNRIRTRAVHWYHSHCEFIVG